MILNLILKDVASGKFKFDPTAEDIPSNIQELLVKKIGQPAHKFIRNRHGDIKISNMIIVLLAANKLHDIRMIHAQDPHVRSAPGSPLFDRLGCGIINAHE